MQLSIENKEISLTLDYTSKKGVRPSISILGHGDLSHHLIEGLFDIVDKLARIEGCCHKKEEYQI